MKKWTYILLIGSILGLGIPGTLFANEKAIVVDGEWSNDPIGWRFNAVSASLPPKELGSHAFPKLSFAKGKGYAQDPDGKGIHPNKGTANKTSMTFKVIYTHENNEAPTSAHVIVKPTNGATTTLPLTAVSSHASSTLADGIYANGEQYVATTTFPKGEYTYHFEVSDGTATTTFPANETLSFTTGYSNVVLVPGVKASRLFTDNVAGENKLWEPGNSQDAQILSLLHSGKSAHQGVYTKADPYDGLLAQIDNPYIPDDPLGVTRGNIYYSFLDFMNTLEQDGVINEWSALPYDWRLHYEQILSGGHKKGEKLFYTEGHATGTPYIKQQIEHLARTSANGEVTIVAHSMGGLITKYLLSELENNDDPLIKKIDNVIFVGTPHLGTPQAIGAMLHGTKEAVPEGFGFFLEQSEARSLVHNMPSAYSLLPFEAYTERVRDEKRMDTTLVKFDSSLLKVDDDSLPLNAFIHTYGNRITDAGTLRDFLLGKEGRDRPAKEDITHPEVVSENLFTHARDLHNRLDNWTAPDLDGDGTPDIDIVQIAGWGSNETVRGVEYSAIEKEKFHSSCDMMAGLIGLLACSKETTYELIQEPMFTTDGDGTVVLPSAVAMREQEDVETYYVDLYNYNRENIALFIDRKNREHGSLLEVDSARILTKNILTNHTNPDKNLSYIEDTESDLPKHAPDPYLRLSLHSPITVALTDDNDRRVGATSTDARLTEAIPNSYALRFGEGTYLGVPLAEDDIYTLNLSGTGTGTFTLKFTHQSGGTTTQTHTFANVPVSTTTEASLTLATTSDTTSLTLDHDGDGTPDVTAFSDEHADTITFATVATALKDTDTVFTSTLVSQLNAARTHARAGTHHASYTQLRSLADTVMFLTKDWIPEDNRLSHSTALRLRAMIGVLAERQKEKIDTESPFSSTDPSAFSSGTSVAPFSAPTTSTFTTSTVKGMLNSSM